MSSDAKYGLLDEDRIANADIQSAIIQDEVERRRRRRDQRLSNCLSWYSVLTTTIVLILSVAILKSSAAPPSNCLTRPYTAMLGKHREYQSLDHRYDEIWNDVDEEQLSFFAPDPDREGKKTATVLAMFHQLHCLSSFRRAIQSAREGKDPGFDYHDNPHWPHCLDYMRNTILCWADDTMERRSFFDNGTRSNIISGYYDQKQCGDSRKLIKTMRDTGRIVRTKPFP